MVVVVVVVMIIPKVAVVSVDERTMALVGCVVRVVVVVAVIAAATAYSVGRRKMMTMGTAVLCGWGFLRVAPFGPLSGGHHGMSVCV